jgi:copper homeostasis protein
MSDVLVEVCVDSIESAMAAERGGGGRIELCANLLEGGTTPSAGMIELARRNLTIPIHVIIRPRGGDFCYSVLEVEVMRHDIEAAKQLGADGVVIGALKADGTIDAQLTHALIMLARPMSVTFHRAFDMARDPYASLETLSGLGIDRLLTSGQEQSALEGLELITELVRKAGDRIMVMPGGGIHERNAARIVVQSRAREIHVTARTSVESPMQYRHPRAFMGGELRPHEFSRSVADAERVGEIVRAAHTS